jgi:hypothetical protein
MGNHNVRGHTFSVVFFAFFAGGAFFACTALRLDGFFPRLVDGFIPALPGFVCLANGEADSSESDEGENTADSSDSEDGGDGAIAVFALAFLAGAFFACTALRLDGASSVAMCASAA